MAINDDPSCWLGREKSSADNHSWVGERISLHANHTHQPCTNDKPRTLRGHIPRGWW
jgi:hypothetical protein